MEFNESIPIYIQIKDEFKKNIISNKYALGSKVSSVRDLAIEYGVNPNTVQRALSELEREGLLYTERTSGRFISNDQSLLNTLKVEAARDVINKFINDLRDLGFDDESIKESVEKSL